MGKEPEILAKSVFIEKLHARGYEVLLLNEPLDEIFVQNIKKWKWVNSRVFIDIHWQWWHLRAVPYQDVAKAGLKFGDESVDDEKAELEAFTERFKPLLTWLKKEAGELVRDGKGPVDWDVTVD